jgi:nitrite reductase/ring-hydroxylating ferredoxin subunit
MEQVRVASRSELEDGARVVVQVGGEEIVVLAHDGEVFAYGNVCPHQGGPVGEGMIVGRVEAVTDEHGRPRGEAFSKTDLHLVCPWHGFEFNLRSGVCATNRKLALRRFETALVGDDVYLVLSATPAAAVDEVAA